MKTVTTKSPKFRPWTFALLLSLLTVCINAGAQQQQMLPVNEQQQMIPVYDQTGGRRCVVVVDSVRLSRQGTVTAGLYLVTSLTDNMLLKSDKVTLLPRLFTATDSVDFPEVRLTGPMRPMGQALPYSRHIPYQPWMEKALLKIIVSLSDDSGTECRPSSSIIGEKHMILSKREVRTESTTSNTQQLQGRAYFKFAVNMTDLRPELGNNRRELKKLHTVLDSLRRVEHMYIRHIFLKGFASPEGSYTHNEELAKGRVESLRQYLTSHYDVSDSIISTDYEAEDWVGLRDYVEHSQLAGREQILTIIDTPEDPDRKLTLIQQRYPAAYKQMNAEAFPLLRHTDYSIDYSITKDSKHENIQEVTDTTYAYWLPIYDEPLRPVIRYARPVLVYNTPLLSVKTNLLLDAAYIPGYDRWCPIPNVALEYYPKKGHFTYGASFDMPWWQDYAAHKYFQFRNYQLETRYYFKGANKTHEANKTHGANEANEAKGPYRPYRGFYLQGYAHAAVFGICFDANRGWVGEGAGAGIGAGYVVPLGRNGHWRMEFGVQVGFFRCKYDPYKYENPVNPAFHDALYYYKWTGKPELFKKRQYRWNWIGPTRVGITLTYDLLYRRTAKKGISLKTKEWRTIEE